MCEMTFIKKDIELFDKNFPNLINWNEITWVTHDECSREWLQLHTNYNPKDKNPIFYSIGTKTIVLDKEGMPIDWLRLHEMGHAVHHLLYDFKRFNFDKKYGMIINLYWGIPEYRRPSYHEIFADVFADTMLRYLNPNCVMFKHNKQMIKLLQDKIEIYRRMKI